MDFGHIASVSIGDIFSSRRELHEGGVHAPLQAGIDGNSKEGACSIVLSKLVAHP
jgi:putative restriction endonuclease